MDREAISDKLPENQHLSGFRRRETGQLKDRAFSELQDNGIVGRDLNYDEERIEYVTDNGDAIGTVVYACFENISYLSWVSVKDPFEDNGLGTELIERSIRRMKRKGVNRIYVLPKSDKASRIFKKQGFNEDSDINGFYIKYINQA